MVKLYSENLNRTAVKIYVIEIEMLGPLVLVSCNFYDFDYKPSLSGN